MAKGIGVHFQHLFAPIQVGRLRLRNRIVMPPMSTNFADPERLGFVSEKHMAYYGERARGGAGLIIVEATGAIYSTGSRRLGLGLYEDRFIPGLSDLVRVVKSSGAACGIQIAPHGVGRIGAMKMGALGNSDRTSPEAAEYFAASPLPHPMTGITAHELSWKQLHEIAVQLARAAKRAKQAGFDFIEIHGAHGYLLHEFLSPRTNKRTDRYGGDAEGRSRFPLDVVRGVKDVIGNEVVLSYRLNATDFVEGGVDIKDSIIFAKELENAGIDIIHVSGGINETPLTMNCVIPPMSYPRGRLIPYAERVKKEISIPVIVVQRINTPDLADEVIRTGKADLVATGRALIADSHWPLKAREGRVDEIRRCIACNQGCMEQIVFGKPLTCLYSPEVGYEHLYHVRRKADTKKRVLVLGGGPAGMEAASVLAERGHTVCLIEKEDRPGGAARLGSILDDKKEFSAVTEYMQKQLKRLNVEVRLKTNVDPSGLEENDKESPFDEIIVATGAEPVVPAMDLQMNRDKIRMAKEVLANPGDVGQNVYIIGGGSVGIEVAGYLHGLGKQVTVIEMTDKICADLGPLNRADVLQRLTRLPITIMLNTTVLGLNPEGMRVSRDGKEDFLRGFNTVVVAMGAKPAPLSLPGIMVPVHLVGDCRKIGNAMDAIHDAFNTAVGL